MRRRDIQVCAVSAACGAVIGFAVDSAAVGIVVAAAVACSIRWRIALAVVVGFGVGTLRGMVAIPEPLPTNGTVLSGVVIEDPAVGAYTTSVVLDTGRRIVVASGALGSAAFGDALRFRCASWTWRSRFSTPRCRATGVAVLAHRREGLIRGALHGVTAWLLGSMRRALPSPESPFLAGLLLGSRDEIPSELVKDFRTSGTSHIVAVSGYNVTIVVVLLASLLSRMPLPRNARLALTLAAIASFVGLTGASASVVRAGVMGSIAVIGREAGRVVDVTHVLLLAATGMIVADPSVTASIGFQLSVTATFGLITFGSAISERLTIVPESLGLRSALGSSLAAIAATSPLIVLYFGQFSVVAPFTNLLVLPLVPLAMLTGFIVSVVCAVVPFAAPYVSWIAWAPLSAIIGVVTFSARVPFASVALGPAASIALAAGVAGTVGYAVVRSARRRTHA